ncbi:FAD-binding domain-containing protein [Orrella daihaiensis]|uniref:Deoxyribodipyrimidine photo-lyase n=1 Tax=Orrella daihaiensis TaxID=2782176 RepID=A0ABY4AI68_9BURK|nr:FAD-binding domain-containing protein [Orrella daihaiensis]UOD49623.1 deoxyribodipyrimidine photo-lyase [Orrella daihaiensis]
MEHIVVWFKRDLRIHDHQPLAQAAKRGALTCVYFIEPSLWRSPDAGTQHYQFILESLRDLHTQLAGMGLKLNLLVGEAIQCLERIRQTLPFAALYSHEETGNGLTYARDKAVARWCRENGIQWQEFAQFGVKRGPHDRDHWKSAWESFCGSFQVPVPGTVHSSPLRLIDRPPNPMELGLTDPDPPARQLGGRQLGLQTLQTFLHERSQQYRGGISSPLSAPTACSRVSAYLSYGCLSMREVYQATQNCINSLPPGRSRHKQGLQSFVSRLYWHCHFIQKLEDEPELEFRNLHRGYDGLREGEWSGERFEALREGRTGWPLVDACVAMLGQTGWLNFRMRAMLVSVAAYPLWLHWREVGHWLARQFLDYEPGIHWSQMQMQSGTTGINVPRIYNPIKQAKDHDPRGVFVRHWLPAMRQVPDAWLFEPWRMPDTLQNTCGIKVGSDIATPVCDLDSSTRRAKQKVFDLRATPAVRAAKSAIVKKHGSRKQLESSPTMTRKSKAKPVGRQSKSKPSVESSQLSLDF